MKTILLAGGQSRRFGSPKALVLKEGVPLVVDRYHLLQSLDSEPIILAGDLAPTIRALLPEARVISDGQEGPVAALTQLKTTGLHLVMAVDMPKLEHGDLQAFIAAASGPAILGAAPATLPCLLDLPLSLRAGRSLKAQLGQQNAVYLQPAECPADHLVQFNTMEAWRDLRS
ncbi:MAG: hypothetical protein CMH55_01125 [Myxococcales bacterium]|nr:hypothetical protein [Myxococcales bacterium]|tara:strand:- start:50 stop:565 length:516 start_codon:yes stop_codon:yes gene_type:complete